MKLINNLVVQLWFVKYVGENLAVRRLIIVSLLYELWFKTLMESLILAQDERWRRA